MKNTIPALKISFTKAALGLVAGAALVAGAVYFSGNDARTPEDPMSAAQKIVSDNLAKPCAAAAGEISAILLSDPNLKCDGPKVLAP